MLIKKVEEAEVISLKHGIQMIKLHFSVLFLTLSNHGPSFPNAIHTVPLSGINHSLFNSRLLCVLDAFLLKRFTIKII